MVILAPHWLLTPRMCCNNDSSGYLLVFPRALFRRMKQDGGRTGRYRQWLPQKTDLDSTFLGRYWVDWVHPSGYPLADAIIAPEKSLLLKIPAKNYEIWPVTMEEPPGRHCRAAWSISEFRRYLNSGIAQNVETDRGGLKTPSKVAAFQENKMGNG